MNTEMEKETFVEFLTFPFHKNRVSKNGAKQISDEGRQLASAVCRGFGRNAS